MVARIPASTKSVTKEEIFSLSGQVPAARERFVLIKRTKFLLSVPRAVSYLSPASSPACRGEGGLGSWLNHPQTGKLAGPTRICSRRPIARRSSLRSVPRARSVLPLSLSLSLSLSLPPSVSLSPSVSVSLSLYVSLSLSPPLSLSLSVFRRLTPATVHSTGLVCTRTTTKPDRACTKGPSHVCVQSFLENGSLADG